MICNVLKKSTRKRVGKRGQDGKGTVNSDRVPPLCHCVKTRTRNRYKYKYKYK